VVARLQRVGGQGRAWIELAGALAPFLPQAQVQASGAAEGGA